MPNTNFARRRQRHQLIANEEQIFNANIQIEDAHIVLIAVVEHAPQTNLAAIRNGNHFALRLLTRSGEIGFDRQAFDGRFNVRRSEHQLPAGRIFQAIACNKVRIRGRYPIVMRFNDLNPKRIGPSVILMCTEYKTDIVANHFIQIDGRIPRMPQIQRSGTRVGRCIPALRTATGSISERGPLIP